MTGSFLVTPTRAANSKLAAKTAGYRIRVGSGQAIGVKASVRRTSTTRCERNLPAIVITGAGRAFAALALPAAPGHARTTAGLLNWFGPVARCSFAALVQSCQKASRCITQTLHASFVAPAFHEQKRDMEGFGSVQKVFGEFRNAI